MVIGKVGDICEPDKVKSWGISIPIDLSVSGLWAAWEKMTRSGERAGYLFVSPVCEAWARKTLMEMPFPVPLAVEVCDKFTGWDWMVVSVPVPWAAVGMATTEETA